MDKVVHFEVPYDDVDRAHTFYREAFGWQLQSMPMAEGEYTVVMTTPVDEQTQLPPMVRLVIIGGEAVNPARLADWAMLPTASIRLLNTYGCTETALITHAIDLLGPIFPVPIGSPLPHVMQLISQENGVEQTGFRALRQILVIMDVGQRQRRG